MKATLNIQVTIDNRNVTTKLGMGEGMDDMEITLMQNVLKVMSDVQKKVKKEVDRFYGDPEGETTEAPGEAAENTDQTEV